MQVKDPVCGMMLEDTTAPAQSTYEGTKYYFCSEQCKKSFEAAPARYATPVGAGTKE